MDPLAWLLDNVIAGKYGAVATLIVIAVILSRAATKLELHAKGLVDAIKAVGADLTKAREEDRAEHVRTRERLDSTKGEIIAAVASDGGTTRGELAALEERRWSDINHALDRASDTATPATGMPVVRRSGGTHQGVR